MKLKDIEFIIKQVNAIEKNILFVSFSMTNTLNRIKNEQNPLLSRYRSTNNIFNTMNNSDTVIKVNNCLNELNRVNSMAKDLRRVTITSLNEIKREDGTIANQILKDNISYCPGIGDQKGWFEKTGNYLLYGNYTEDVTFGGVLINVGIGLVGLDLPMDVRDLTYNVTHWKWTPGHMADTALTAVSIIPIIGSIKYLGDGAKAIKNVSEAGTVVKKIDLDVLSESKLIKKYDSFNLYSHNANSKTLFESTSRIDINYHRPYIRKSTKELISDRLMKESHGKYYDGTFFRDPNTFDLLTDKYHIGHKTGYEYWKLESYAKANGFTQKQFNDFVNNPKFYQFELPKNNLSHKYEFFYSSDGTKVDLNRLALDKVNR